MKNKTVYIIGLGYVGLPLAEAFSSHLKTIAFDIDEEKVKRLSESNNKENIEFTSDPSKIKQADFVLICVPTPVTKSKEPDLSFVKLFCFAKTFTKKMLTLLFCKQKPLLKKSVKWVMGKGR
jgi:UDPglucose 6-dehydrogenase/UDP-N-acetyl-D-galactosamine dehydrogenase